MSFYHGLSGLNASSKNLDVIGNNIANSSTTGFKASRAEFNEMVANAMGAASGKNSGIGVGLAAVAQQFSLGVIVPTNNGLDMAINGDGFFVVNTTNGTAYTRSGNFQLNKMGELVTVNGDKVMGYPVDPNTGLRTSVTPTELIFPTGAPIPAKQTQNIWATLNLDARANLAAGDPAATPPIEPTPRATYGTSVTVYDSLGAAHPATVYFEKTGPNQWAVYDSLDPAAASIGTLTFNNNGTLASAVPAPPAAATDPFQLTITPGTGAASPFAVNFDMSKATQYGSSWSIAKIPQDGYASGELTDVQVSADGTLTASYSNGVTRAEAQVAVAKFANVQGLIPDGNNNWVASNDSGEAILGTAGSGTFGNIQGNALEQSNVDLTAELVNMMTAQRAYQANAQTIKTQDQIFSTLVNLR